MGEARQRRPRNVRTSGWGEFMKTIRRLVGLEGREEKGQWRRTAAGARALPQGQKCSQVGPWYYLHSPVNILKPIQLCTLNAGAVGQVNYISIKLFKNAIFPGPMGFEFMEVTECRPTWRGHCQPKKTLLTSLKTRGHPHHPGWQSSGGRERSEGKAKARTFTGVSAGKASQHRVNNAGLAYLNNSGCRAVSPPPVPGPGIMQHKENTVLVCESDKEVTEGWRFRTGWFAHERHTSGRLLLSLGISWPWEGQFLPRSVRPPKSLSIEGT